MSGRILLEAHAHTKEGSRCGWLPAADLLRDLHAAGFGAVLITDHFLPGERTDRASREAFLDGWRAACEAAQAYDMVVLPAMEIRFRDHPEDYLVYGLEEADFADLPDNACEMGLSSFFEIADAKGWRIYQAHPFRRKMLPAHPGFIHGMEVFNGNPRHNSQNRLAANFATLHSLHTIAGSDVHRPGDVGLAGLLVPKSALTPKGFAEWLAATPHPRVQYQEAPIDGIRYVTDAIPGREMLAALYHDAGWTSYTADLDETMDGIRSSARIVSAWDDTTLIGFARAVGDGHTVSFVPDLLVLGTYRRRGIGRNLLRQLLLPYRRVRQTAIICDDRPESRLFLRACGFEAINGYGCTGYLRLRT